MNPWSPHELKKEIRHIAGRDLSCKLLQEYIEKSADRDNLILQIAFVLRQAEIKDKKTWDELRKTFMSRYAPEMNSLYHLEAEWLTGEKIGVADMEAFAEVVRHMYEQGIIEPKSENQLINLLFNIFDLPLSKTSLLLKIKR